VYQVYKKRKNISALPRAAGYIGIFSTYNQLPVLIEIKAIIYLILKDISCICRIMVL
jgi:hypothetical protein